MSLIQLDFSIVTAWLTFSLVFLIWILFRFSARGERRVVRYTTFFMAALIWWQSFYILEILVRSLAVKLFFADLQFIGLFSIPFLWLMLTFAYINKTKPIHKLTLAWYAYLAVGVFALVTNRWLHLFRGTPVMRIGAPFLSVDYDYGVYYYFGFLPVIIGLFLVSLVYLIRQLQKSQRIYRWQLLTMIVLVIINLVASSLYNLGYFLVEGVENISFTLPLTSLIIFIALRNFKLFNLIPLANDIVVANLSDGIVVVDEDGLVISFNPFAASIIPELTDDQIGKSFDFSSVDQHYSALDCIQLLENETSLELEFLIDLTHKFIELILNPIYQDGILIGTIFHFRDVTDRVLLYQKLHFSSQHDSLTGLLNRHSFFEEAELLFHQAVGNHRCLGVVMLDFDDFKQINDIYGHLTGDSVLAEVAAVCKHTLRQSDLLGRYGGDEFIFLINECPDLDHNITQILERIQENIGRLNIQGVVPKVSMGSAILDEDHPESSFAVFVEQADKELYRQKNLRD